MGTYARYNGLGAGGGTGGPVTSVGLADGSSVPIYNISGSPVTSTGTLTFTLASQSANKVFAGPTTGAATQPAFRSIVAADLPTGNLTDAGTDGITITGGTGAIIGAGVSVAQHVADSTHNGYLSSADWTTFNNKQSALTFGNLTDAGTDGITVTGGTGAVIGSGTSIAQHVADTTHNGYLSSTDWNTFNGKQAALTIGNFTDAGTDGITVTGGTGAVIGSGTSIAQHVADASHNGYLSSADWTTFNSKGSGSVTSVTFTGDGTVLSSTPSSAVTTSGTITASIKNQNANVILAGPASGSAAAPTFRALVPGDMATTSVDLYNLGLNASISSNTLVVALTQSDGSTNPSAGSGAVLIGVRSATATTGSYSISTVTASSSITLGTTDSIGVTASALQILYVYWISDTTSELGLSATLFDEGSLQTTSALTGGADTDATKLWTANAHTSRPIRLIGRLVAQWGNPNWSLPAGSEVTVSPFTRGMQTFTVTATAGAAASGSTGGTAGSNGTGTWVCPNGVERVLVTGRGGGGGGGGGGNTSNGSGSGGGGAASVSVWTAVVPGTSYTLTAGAGGAGGGGVNGSGVNGSDGTDSTFGSLLTFKGGQHGSGGGQIDQYGATSVSINGSGTGGGGRGGSSHQPASINSSVAASVGRAGSPGLSAAGGTGSASFAGGGGGGDGAGGNGGASSAAIGAIGTSGGGGGGGGENSGAAAGGGAGAGGTGSITVSWWI